MDQQQKRESGLPSLKIVAAQIQEHWRQFNPKLYRELVAQGNLEQEAERRAQETEKAAFQFQAGGMSPQEAASEAMREVALAILK